MIDTHVHPLYCTALYCTERLRVIRSISNEPDGVIYLIKSISFITKKSETYSRLAYYRRIPTFFVCSGWDVLLYVLIVWGPLHDVSFL